MKMLKWLTFCFAIILFYSGNVYAQLFLDFEVSKDCIDHGIIIEGDPVLFEINITNTGNVNMDFMVEDPYDPSVNGMYFIPAGDTLTILAQVSTDGECSDDGIVYNEVTVQPYIGGEPVLEPLTVETGGCPILCPCNSAIVIPPAGIQVIPGNTSGANNDAVPSCAYSPSAPDDLYVFTLNTETMVTASVSGFDTVLYIREVCDDPGTELACNDDNNPPGNYGSYVSETLPPGEYYLIVDGYYSYSGSYQLTVDFGSVTCGSDVDCNGGEYCFKDACFDVFGTCEVRPDVCTQEYFPVCGCNGVTYDNGCFAAMDGVSVDYEGYCPSSMGFDVAKQCNSYGLPIDEVVPFEIYIDNIGDAPLEFMVNDPAAEIIDEMIGPLFPGESYILVVEVPFDCSSNGYVFNEVIVQAYYDGAPVLAPVSDSAECFFICDDPGIYGNVSGAVQGGVYMLLYRNSCGSSTLEEYVLTAADGSYEFTGLSNGNYKVKPLKTGYAFSPLEQILDFTNTAVMGVNFTAY